MTSTAVYGIYHRDDIQSAVNSLRRHGFRGTHLSLLLFPATYTGMLESTSSSASVTNGAVRKWRVNIEALAIPGVGPLIAVGPRMTTRNGQGWGDIKTLIRLLVEWGVPEGEARRYESRIKSGDILLSLHCGKSDGMARAERLLKKTAAEDVTSGSETRGGLLEQQSRRTEMAAAFHH